MSFVSSRFLLRMRILDEEEREEITDEIDGEESIWPLVLSKRGFLLWFINMKE